MFEQEYLSQVAPISGGKVKAPGCGCRKTHSSVFSAARAQVVNEWYQWMCVAGLPGCL